MKQEVIDKYNDKLKTCPFCGSEARIFQLPETKEFVIGCDGKLGSLCPCYIYKISPVYFTEEVAIKYWNNREGETE